MPMRSFDSMRAGLKRVCAFRLVSRAFWESLQAYLCPVRYSGGDGSFESVCRSGSILAEVLDNTEVHVLQRVTAGHPHHYPSHTEDHLSADLQQLHPYGMTLGLGQLSAFQTHTS